jgi:glutamyl-tRNA reductase
MRRFVLLGCNHSSASLEEVAHAKLPEEQRETLVRQVCERLGAEELVYLSTCHRTEWYLVYEGELCPGRLTMALGTSLPTLTSGRAALPGVDHCVAMHGGEVAHHLFRVASALESLMLGESQILGQVKEAFRQATDAGLVGPRLTTLFTQAFRGAKRVRTETALSRRPVSLVSLAERVLRARLEGDEAAVAVIGAGEMAGLTAELVRKLDPARELTIFNRSAGRGKSLADRHAGSYRPLAELTAGTGRFSAVIAATSASSPVIDRQVATRLAPCLLLDLGLPANIAAECAAVEGIELIDQGALQAEADANRGARAEELAKAESIIDDQLRELAYELMEHELSPVARSLVATFRELARSELERVTAGAPEMPSSGLDEAAERLSQRLVRVPLKALREVAWQHSTDVLTTFLAAVKQ